MDGLTLMNPLCFCCTKLVILVGGGGMYFNYKDCTARDSLGTNFLVACDLSKQAPFVTKSLIYPKKILMVRPLFRPKTNHTYHQKPISRETVPLKIEILLIFHTALYNCKFWPFVLAHSADHVVVSMVRREF